ncbi:hypothetical protein ACHAQA_007088 [Verticillium albo-atrum]
MASKNRIAIYGHRGWASSVIVEALLASGAALKVLYRPGSDASGLPAHVTAVQVDLDDHENLVAALQDVDIVISLVGHEGVASQHAFVKAIPATSVKLFVPSDLAARYDEQGLRISLNVVKHGIEEAAKAAGIPLTVILPGNFAEFALNTIGVGIDKAGNRIVFTGNSAQEPINLCTREYVAAAYVEIFTSTPLPQIQNRQIGLCELRATGTEIAATLEKLHGAAPETFNHSLEKVNAEVENAINTGMPSALSWHR